MAISGSLRDVSVADVMQFVYIGQQTGSLHVSRGTEAAVFLFHEGRLVRACSPHSQNIGDLLIGRLHLAQNDLDEVLARRSEEDRNRPLGQVLVERGLITPTQLGEALEIQIQQAINGVLNWEDGSFEFRAGDVETPDRFRSSNEILVPEDGFNPQQLLLEVARIFDERGRVDDAPSSSKVGDTNPTRRHLTEAAAIGDALRTTERWRRSLDAFFDEAGGGRSLTELWWVSEDAGLFRKLSQALVAKPVRIRRVGGTGGRRLDTSGPEPLILVDLRQGGSSLDELRGLRSTQEDATLVAIVDPDAAAANIFAAGAQALLPADPAAIVTFVEHVLPEWRSKREQQPMSATGVQRLRRVFDELRAGLISATVALNLMRLISESYERAVLLLIKREVFSVLGAFGPGAGGRPLAEVARGLVLRNGGEDVFSRMARSTEVFRVEPSPLALPEAFRAVLGGPPPGELSVFSIGGAERVIGLVYADHPGELPEEEKQILELAASQVGIALENELLRRKVEASRGRARNVAAGTGQAAAGSAWAPRAATRVRKGS